MTRVDSAIGCDPGLASFGLAHVRQATTETTDLPFPDYELCSNHEPCSGVFLSAAEEGTVAESNAARTRDLAYWLDVRLRGCVAAGAEAVAAERYEHLRGSADAAKLAAGHAALVSAFSRLDPLPRAQRYGNRLPCYPSAREVKRAVVGCSEASKRVVIRAAARLVGGAATRLAGMTAENRAHLADAIAVALWRLDARARPILIGEAPKEAGDEPFRGRCGARLRQLLGSQPKASCRLCKGSGINVSVDAIEADGRVVNPREEPCLICCGSVPALPEFFDLRNLLAEPQGSDPHGKGDAFPTRKARAAAEKLEPILDGRAVIFAGGRVASAFGFKSGGGLGPDGMPPDLGLLEWHEVRSGGDAYMAAVLPHPSGVNRWWNEPRNVARARTFLRAAARG